MDSVKSVNLAQAMGDPNFMSLVNDIQDNGNKMAQALQHIDDPNWVPGSDSDGDSSSSS